MRKSLRAASFVPLLPLALAACGGGGGSTTVASPPAAQSPTSFQSKFGTSFAAIFDTSATTADASVKDPTTADLPALSLTTEPLDN